MWLESFNPDILTRSLLPDLFLSFALFTSLAYSTLISRFEHKRIVTVLSTVIGLALSVGLVSWEYNNGMSIKNLGPVALLFLILVLGVLAFKIIQKIGGVFVGSAVAVGLSLIAAQMTGLSVYMAPQVFDTMVVIMLFVALFALVTSRKGPVRPARIAGPVSRKNDPLDLTRLFRERHLSQGLENGFHKLRRRIDQRSERPEQATDIVLQLKKMLPAQGYLTERMASLRTKAHQIRKGHIARLEETREVYSSVPLAVKRKAAAALASGYTKLIGMDTRLARLDRAVGENEKQIRKLTQKAQVCAARYDYPNLATCLKEAQTLQHHNTKLFKTINHTENRLKDVARVVASQAQASQ